MRKEAARNSGIDIIGEVNWGTHFCQLYHIEKELMDILAPYVKTGLENNELCVWITLNSLEAKKALQKSIPDLNSYLENKQIEIIPYNDWYLKTGFFDPQEVLNGLIRKLKNALTSNYDGLRLTEDVFYLEEYRDDFVEYEKKINRVIGDYQILALCTYALKDYSAAEIINVITSHQFALVKKGGRWVQIKNFR